MPLSLLWRAFLVAFVLHLSGAAHLLVDVLLDDDMTCVDEQAHGREHGSTAPRCPAGEGMGHGQGFVPPVAASSPIAFERDVAAWPRTTLGAAPFVAPACLERPPRA